MEIEVIHSNNPYYEKGQKKTGNLGGRRVWPRPRSGGMGSGEWGPQIAPPAGEKMIKDTQEVVRFRNCHECYFQWQVVWGT